MSRSPSTKKAKAIPFYTIHISGSFIEKKMVPASPTIEMLDAAIHALDGVDLSKLNRKDRAKIKAAIRWQAMLAEAPMLSERQCRWTPDDDGVYQTACGEAFTFIDSGPKENGMKFCGYCGGTMDEQCYEKGKP